MNAPDPLTYYVIPIGGALLFGIGVVSWQRSERFWAGQLIAPRSWETAAIVVGTAALLAYVGFVVPYQSSALRLMTMVFLGFPAVAAVGLTWLSGRNDPDRVE